MLFLVLLIRHYLKQEWQTPGIKDDPGKKNESDDGLLSPHLSDCY